MTLDFSEPCFIIIQMINYIKNLLHDAPDEMDRKAMTPVAAHHLKINQEDPVPLPPPPLL